MKPTKTAVVDVSAQRNVGHMYFFYQIDIEHKCDAYNRNNTKQYSCYFNPGESCYSCDPKHPGTCGFKLELNKSSVSYNLCAFQKYSPKFDASSNSETDSSIM